MTLLYTYKNSNFKTGISLSEYTNWKNWTEDSFGFISKNDYFYFRKLLKKFTPNSVERVLEIGFGNGSFLAYLRELNIDSIGVEIEKQLVSAAKNKGFEVYEDISQLDYKFDLIVLFDVLEHIPANELLNFLEKLESLLAANGKIIVRVPNGSSPFGLTNQHGDPTHVNIFTTTKLAFYTDKTNLSIKYSGGDVFPIFNGSVSKLPGRILKITLRAIIERITRFIFSPLSKGILSANAIYILERQKR